MRTSIIVVSILALCLYLISCNKDKYNSEPPGYGNMILKIGYNVDGIPLVFDNIKYKNNAGNTFSVTRLQYYLSGLRFYKNGEQVYSIDSVFYVDASVPGTNTILINQIPSFMYDALSFYIGVENKLNVHGKIASTAQNTAMEWPDMMGGGYHFLKLEGHFKDSVQNVGYAMHLGTNDMQPACKVYKSFYIPANGTTTCMLTMNINEWFRNPNTYNISKDGVYTMGNMMLMRKIADNGVDVFSMMQ